MSDKETTSQPAKNDGRINGKGASVLFQVMLVFFLVATGWALRSMMPEGSPTGGPPPGMGGGGGPVGVLVEQVEEASSVPAKEFIGHVRALQTVDLHTQAAGYLEKVHFTEGSLVHEGDLLFTVEQAPFEARVALAEANLTQAKANLTGARADVDSAEASVSAAKSELDRAVKYMQRLEGADTRSVVQADLDVARNAVQQAESQRIQAEAQLVQSRSQVSHWESMIKQATASLDLARIDLGYTEIKAPITGRIGLVEVTKGNYVSPNTPRLARIVQEDPIRVVFSMTDREYIDSLQLKKERGEQAYSVRLRLPNGTEFPVVGHIDFADNEMNMKTGTIANYGRFQNAAGLLIPGAYVTVALVDTSAPTLPVVPEEAIMLDAEGASVFVVDAESKAVRRRIERGTVSEGRQYVTSGLEAGERVIVQGLQRVRSGDTVNVSGPSAQEGSAS